MSIHKVIRVISGLMLVGVLGSVGFAQTWDRDISIRSGFNEWEQVRWGVSGGSVDASRHYGRDSRGEYCAGYVYSQYDHLLTILEPLPYLVISVEGDEDTTLVLYNWNTGQVYCDDDSGYGLNAAIAFRSLPRGVYEVRVGSYSRNDFHDYTLHVSERYAPFVYEISFDEPGIPLRVRR